MRISKTLYLPVLLGVILTLSDTMAEAMEFSFRPFTFPGTDRPIKPLIASGEIRQGDALRLRQFLGVRANAITFTTSALEGGAGGFIILDSPGGNIDEAIRLAQVMRDILATVDADPPMVCASACFFLWVGAAKRGGWGGKALAVHRPFFSADVTQKMSLAQAEAAHNAAFSRAKRWLQDQLVPQTLIDRMFSLPSTQAYWLTSEDVQQLGRRAPWYEEWLLARCPDYIKAYQRFVATFGTANHAEAAREADVQLRCENHATESAQATVLVRYVKELERSR